MSNKSLLSDKEKGTEVGGEEETGRKGRERKSASSKATVPLSNGTSSPACKHLHTQKVINNLKHSFPQLFRKTSQASETHQNEATYEKSEKFVPRE